MSKVLVTGGAGFIGHHLVKRLKADGHWVRAVDIQAPPYERSPADEGHYGDLRQEAVAWAAVSNIDVVYHLACDMGGILYTTPMNFSQRLNNTRIDLNVLQAAKLHQPKRVFYASSACVYNELLQDDLFAAPLTEDDAYPAQPDLSYGWVKLMGERALAEMTEDTSIQPFIARFHNVYGQLGTYDGGKEKAPAALCRKIALAKLRGERSISIWGDGQQQRSFMYIDDCIEGILRLTASDYYWPLNLGSDELVSINGLADLIMRIAGYPVDLDHDLTKPQGVRSRNSDNARLRAVLGWSPQTDLSTGLEQTYWWIEEQVAYKLEKDSHYDGY